MLTPEKIADENKNSIAIGGGRFKSITTCVLGAPQVNN
jgi:hypothetical protein